VEDLLGQIPQPPFQRDDIHGLISLLMDFLPEVDALALSEYPKLLPEKRVRGAMKPVKGKHRESLKCLPACAMALIPNSPQTRGVLFELRQMADRPTLSKPVRILLGEQYDGPQVSQAKPAGRVPAVLSHSQQEVLNSASSAPLTLVIGPPGTGKSYTIAALALDHLSRGESVLIASRMNHAVDVVARKIETLIGPSQCVIRGGRRQYLRDLKKFLDQILHGMRPAALREDRNVRWMKGDLARCERMVGHLERKLQTHSEWEQHWGLETAGPEPDGLFRKILQKARLGYLNWRIGGSRPLWDLTKHYQDALKQRSRQITALLQAVVDHRIQWMLKHHRADLRKFLQAIKARSDWKQEQLFSQIRLDVLFGTFPIWLVTLADVSEVLPLQRELFDLAIIDEATQCDISSVLPIFERARRVVVVGDPSQLRHVSFLSRQRQQTIAEGNGLDSSQQHLFRYREKSVLDLLSDTIASQQHVLFLDEHFRSMPQIIAFSNREFYTGALKVMTQRPETVDLKCVELRFSPGGRKIHGVNREEARALVDAVVARVEAEDPLPAAYCHSLGILSPFRDQVDHIFSLLQDRLSLEVMNKHDLVVGTAHTFQGEERDVMFLSLVVDPQTHPASFNFLNNPNVFNVSITRARNEQYLFASVRPEDVKPGTLLRRYLDAVARGPRPSSVSQARYPDVFLEDVRSELEQHGCRTWPAYPVAGMKIDLVAERSGRTVGIDLIGHPGEFARALDLERYRMFQRAGLGLFPLSYRAWHENQASCVEAIEGWLTREKR
jgi:hypothetical protein